MEEIGRISLQSPDLHGLAISMDFRHLMRGILFLSPIRVDEPPAWERIPGDSAPAAVGKTDIYDKKTDKHLKYIESDLISMGRILC